LLITRFRTQS